ncbi:tankyrase isoform X2 [Chlorella sorokiniana]|uniref:Poly [ADP-ribose] polymerase n=1 Tax=Chlorella sorokiniana TaxID=3076 RepID=A0A2P6TC00_CHLSO|nr:tankyrase isoform X2 [Chlorella sorokiniana]|eukprot:PRW18413.1 tankyrase isoform X2 [Chlorella sorokiniana]
MVWRLEVFQFDADTRSGCNLNKDLEFLGRTWGPKHAAVELELRFPDNYPDAPFFLRVVRPRMAAYSGHVTAGGAVCLEALSLSGGPGSWRSDMCAEAVLVMVLHNMLHAEEVYVQTAMGGGQAGPLRINKDLGRACIQEYSLRAAQEAYQRTGVAQQPAAATAPTQRGQQPSLCERLGLEESQLPDHWQVSEELLKGQLVLVDLPLSGAALPQDRRHERAVTQLVLNGCSREQAVDIADMHAGDAEASLAWLLEQQQASASQADPTAVAELLANGLTVEDAEAALRQCGGDVDTALAWATDCVEAGGPAAVERLTGTPAAGRSPGGLPAGETAAARRRQAQRAEREAQHCRLQAESGRVLERFAHSGMRKEQVQRIQRVQNLHLYADYRRRRDKIEWLISQSTGGARVGALLNERLLFHGADKETLATIMSEGFDHRVSNTSGAMGAGVYFADTATYSDTYSRTPKHSADVAGSYGGVPGLVHLGGALRAGAQGVLSVAGAWANRSARAAPPPMAPAVRSAFLADCVSMLLCDVTLGIAGVGQPGMRRAAPGSHSSSSGPPGGAIHAVYYNDQAYPAYLIHYR